MSKRVYCTYFDHNYLSRGLALYHSLQRHAPGAQLWVLCLNEQCYGTLTKLALPNLILRSLAQFEAEDREVAATRSARSLIEYYFTCSPAWMRFVMSNEPEAEWVTYLDGDLFFFESPEVIYRELQDASVAIIPHRFTARMARLRKFGTYNVGWVGARNDPDGISVIMWWREKCIEWCHDYVDGGRFADQGYLDSFPGLSSRVKVIENVGANLAPWNVGNYQIDFRDNRVMIDAMHPLIFFHFQGVKKGWGWFIFNSHRRYRAPFSGDMRQHIYQPYIDELLQIESAVDPVLQLSGAKPHRRSAVGDIKQFLADKVRSVGIRLFQLLDIATGRAFLVFRGKAH
ncbi:MAG: hypothetical protein Q7T45_25690 [Bradyrhizobium sp.]|uniref:hypothetical protein n=1 Tax=Bradyrhizobium sp. TaxID=376 RepID=UPI00272061BD|nr:hypothetical protein [Bradyrhizobium sp.]MDO8401205.1 hypothetical protein [Bradyrhizobium sp.]